MAATLWRPTEGEIHNKVSQGDVHLDLWYECWDCATKALLRRYDPGSLLYLSSAIYNTPCVTTNAGGGRFGCCLYLIYHPQCLVCVVAMCF